MALPPKALVLPGLTDQGRSRDGCSVSPVPEARGRAPAGQTSRDICPVLDLCMTQQLPSLCCAGSPHLPVPTIIRAHHHPCWACRGAVHDFTRDWCSWYCSWAGSMHANWKISCGESGLNEENPPRLLLQTQSRFREATSRGLSSLGSPLHQLRAGHPHA